MANNWDMPVEVGCQELPPEALSTRFGGNGAVVFFGLAKPVRTPLIGPAQAYWRTRDAGEREHAGRTVLY